MHERTASPASDEIVSTSLEWHPTNLAIGGATNRAAAAAKTAGQGADVDAAAFDDGLHVGYMDPLAALPSSPAAVGDSMRLRVEYETVRRLRPRDDDDDDPRDVSRWVLFTVRTHLDRLSDLDADTASALGRAMDDADADELAYKSLGSDRLRRATRAFLRLRAGDGDGDGDGAAEEAARDGDAVNNVVHSGVTTKSKCPFFRGGGGAETTTTTTTTADEKDAAAVAVPAAAEDEEEDAKKIARAISLGLEPWPTASKGVAAASTPPSSWYTDAAIIPAIEARAVFAEGWQAVGRVDQVSDVGDYFTGAVGNVKARPCLHWSPYDPVRVLNAVP
eukprot:30238-Pelagococcus_subviridis.AAC.4